MSAVNSGITSTKVASYDKIVEDVDATDHTKGNVTTTNGTILIRS